MHDIQNDPDILSVLHTGQTSPFEKANEDRNCRRELLAISSNRSTIISITIVFTVFFSFFAGLFLIVSGPPVLSILGIVPFCWSMIAAWYLSHDCSHRLVFESRKANQILGNLLSLITGNLYFSFSEHCRDHQRHHIEKGDVVGVKIHELLQNSNKHVKSLVLKLEWAYLPALFFYIKLHYVSELISMGSTKERLRALSSVFIYFSSVLVISTVSPLSLLWIAIAVIGRIHVIRFVDAFQHSFEGLENKLNLPTRGDKNYEQFNTYSFAVSTRFPWLNILILNIGHHNAHHALPSCPWYRLPMLDRTIAEFQARYTQETGTPTYLPTNTMLRLYHRYRLTRILSSSQGKPRDANGSFDTTNFTGAFSDNLLG